MRHRILQEYTGLGNPDPVLLNNTGTVSIAVKKCAKDFCKQWGLSGCDYQIDNYLVVLGIEPSYMYDTLLLVGICRDKGSSFLSRGKSWGAYGSNIVKKSRTYNSYKRNSKFIRFIDKWHKELF